MAATPQMKKPTHKPTYREALDGLLKAIDDAPTAPDHPIFKKWDDKEFFETQLMFSLSEVSTQSRKMKEKCWFL